LWIVILIKANVTLKNFHLQPIFCLEIKIGLNKGNPIIYYIYYRTCMIVYRFLFVLFTMFIFLIVFTDLIYIIGTFL